MAYINTINIAPQEDSQALADAIISALSTALGWTVNGMNIWKPDSGLGLHFSLGGVNNVKVYMSICCSNCYLTISYQYELDWASGVSYCVDYINTGNTVAVGYRRADSMIYLPVCIAANELGGYKAIQLYGSALYCLASDYSNEKQFYLPQNNIDGCATSIMRLPDIFSGTMFKDLYLEFSCPYNSTDKVYYIGGKYYRHIGTGGQYGGLAVPVG